MFDTIARNYPQFRFTPSHTFRWDPKTSTIYFIEEQTQDSDNTGLWPLLHELGHGLLQHQHYSRDMELIRMERDAWVEADRLANNYNLTIDAEHIEDCLDSYRDWHKQRSTCPKCHTVTVQYALNAYRCFNCQHKWGVPSSPLCVFRRYKR